MRQRSIVSVLAIAALFVVFVAGCERTAEGTASAELACAGGGSAGNMSCETTAAAGGGEQSGCAGCPSMTGAVVAEQDAAALECPRGREDAACESGCTCPRHGDTDGKTKCASASLSKDGHSQCKCAGSSEGAEVDGCPVHASAQEGEASCAGRTVETEQAGCPKSCRSAGTCPRGGGSS